MQDFILSVWSSYFKNRNVRLCLAIVLVAGAFAGWWGRGGATPTYVALQGTEIKVPTEFVFNGEVARNSSTQRFFVSYHIDGKTGKPTQEGKSGAVWVRFSVGGKGVPPEPNSQANVNDALPEVARESGGYSLTIKREKFWALGRYPMQCERPPCRELLEVWIPGESANLAYYFFLSDIQNWILYHQTVLNSSDLMGWKRSVK